MATQSLKGLKEAPRGVPKSRMETMIVSPTVIGKWQIPDFQRPIKVNTKVLALVEELKSNGGFIPGIITLGILKGGWYIVDGQHRVEAFKLAELKEGIADFRIMEFDTAAEMAEEFWKLNQPLVPMSADDRLRAMEKSNKALQTIRSCCKFVGYGQLWRSPGSPLLSMTTVLRIWDAAKRDSAGSHTGSVGKVVTLLTVEDAEEMSDFLNACFQAWGNDVEYRRMWGSLNLTILAWLWRRIVVGAQVPAAKRATKITRERFIQCMMALSADQNYGDWLYGRRAESEKSPCYARIKQIFVSRIIEAGDHKPLLPAPEWSAYGGSKIASAPRPPSP